MADPLHSPASSAPLEELLRARLRDHFTFTPAEPPDAPASDDDEAELRLFADPSSAAPATHRIRLASPGAGNDAPGFLVKKPRSYYFARAPTGADCRRLAASAVDGSTIRELASLPWAGCALPWKVTKISPAGLKSEVLVGHPPALVSIGEATCRRARKGKKTRMAIRKKIEADRGKREEQARLAKEKDEADREKRTRRNREKKLKKKAKAQAKKLDAANAQPAAMAHDNSEPMNVDESCSSLCSCTLALLQYHYRERFVIRLSVLGPTAKYGLNFMLKADDGSDPNFKPLPAKKDAKKGRKRKLTKTQQQEEADRQHNHALSFISSLNWHTIEPENIAGFEVMKEVTLQDGSVTLLPHTYLAIMIDDLRSFPFIAETNDVHGGHILTDFLLSQPAHLHRLYDFDNGASIDPDETSFTGVDEPKATRCRNMNGNEMVVDMRTASLDMIDWMFTHVVARDVVYLSDKADASPEKVASG
ncbi:hypothetical protein ACEQ8H_007915 [Pleosporales sp. CAS-2024a]